MKSIYIIGYMGCGKTSLGRQIAKTLDFQFADTDTLVEMNEGATITEIVKYAGMEFFRKAERKVLVSLLPLNNRVVSTGGGLPCYKNNMDLILQNGVSIYFRRPAEQILSRLSPYGKIKRPAFVGKSDEELLEFMKINMAEREPIYSKANYTIDCEHLSDAEISAKVIEIIKNQPI